MLGPVAPCAAWITDADLCCTFDAPPDPAILARSILAATEYLYDRTCRRWPGTTCSATVRPCKPCGCSRDCLCGWTKIRLEAPYPILTIAEFVVDGVDHVAEVRLDANRYLTRLDTATWDGGCWPPQNMSLPLGDVGTWSVKYTYGAEPPAWAKIAAADLACELVKACIGAECALPDGTVSVTKGGVTINLQGPEFTNVRTADQLIANYGCPDTQAQLVDPAERRPVYVGP